MAVVGEAQIIVRAITTGVEKDIRRGFNNLDGAGRQSGRNLGNSFTEGFNRSGAVSVFGQVADGIRSLIPEAEGARLAYQKLARANFALTPALGTLVGAIGSVIGGLGALVGAAGAAAASIAALGSIFTSFGLGMVASKFALGGVGKALGALNNQTGGSARSTREAADETARYAKTLAEVREEMQQLRFDAEEAALSQEEAAIKLEQARDNLMRTADLPINSIARRQAELDFKQADLAYRRAKDRTEDLNEAIKKGIKNPLIEPEIKPPTMGGGADPFAGLNQYQIEFAKFLMSLKPLYKDLQLTASRAFLPPLQSAISLLARELFPTLNRGIGLVASANGQASIAVANAITDAENLSDLDEIFISAARQITELGRIFGNFWDIAASILSSVAPQAERFLSFLEDRTRTFAEFLDTTQAKRRLDDFFQTSGDMLANFGEILGNIFGGFGKLIEANFGPGTGGQYLLDWLISATDKFANLDKLAGGSKNLSDYFLGASVNTQKVLSSVGALLREIVAAGDNPNIGKAFDILAEGAPAIGRILEKAADSGPAFAEFVVQIVEFFDAFTDTRSIEIFWETVTIAVEALNKLLKNEFLMNVLLTISQLAAFALALGSIAKVGKFAFQAIAGSLAFMSGLLDNVVEGFLKVRGVIDTVQLRMYLFNKTLESGSVGMTAFQTGLLKVRLAASVVAAALSAVGRALAPLILFTVIAGVVKGFTEMGQAAEIADENVQRISSSFDQLLSNRLLADQGASVPLLVGITGGLEDIRGGSISVADAFGHANNKVLVFNNALGSIVKNLPGIRQLLEYFGGFNLDNLGNEIAVVEQINTVIGELAGSNLPAATLAFRDLASEAGATTDEALLGMLDQLPALKDELYAFAVANGQATDDVSLLNLAFQRGDTATDTMRRSIEGMDAASLDASGRVQFLADTVRGYLDVINQGLRTDLDYNQSLIDLADTVAQYGFNLDSTTQEGINFQRAVMDSVDIGYDQIAQMVEAGATTDELSQKYNTIRQDLINQIDPYGKATGAAAEYVDTLLKSPDDIKAEVGLTNVDLSKEALEDLYLVEDVPILIDVKPDSVEFQRFKDNIAAEVNKTRNAEVGILAKDEFLRIRILGVTVGTINLEKIVESANGNLFKYVSGSTQAFANGGFPAGIYKGRPGALYKFAEPETRWEAFISGKVGQEKRNISIWQEAGRRLGVYNEAAIGSMQSTFGSQGLSTQSLVQQSAATPKVENTIQITVNPSPGMDERELATVVSRRLAYELRKGTYRA